MKGAVYAVYTGPPGFEAFADLGTFKELTGRLSWNRDKFYSYTKKRKGYTGRYMVFRIGTEGDGQDE